MREFGPQDSTFRPTAWRASHRDPWQIGFGHTEGVQEGDTCTWDQAHAWLAEDRAAAESPT